MTAQTWHLDQQMAERYACGQAGHVLAASIEQHLIGCSACRAQLSPYVDRQRTAQVWTDVLDVVEAPQPSRIERFLRTCGMAEDTARLLAVTPSLRGSWLTGLLFVLVLAQFAARSGESGIALYMALAPVLPMISVAAAFGGEMDPTREMVGAAPYSSLRLLFVRTAAVVAATVVPAVVVSLLLPGSSWLTLGWLLPSLALTAVLALAPRALTLPGAAVLSSGWMALVAIGWIRHQEPFLAATLAVQLTSASVLTAVLLLLLIRHDFIAEEIRRPS